MRKCVIKRPFTSNRQPWSAVWPPRLGLGALLLAGALQTTPHAVATNDNPSIPSREAKTTELHLGKPEAIPQYIYGFNCDLLAATAFEGITFGGPELEAAIRDLQPASLRFPGGTPANNYLWRQDSFSTQKEDLTGWAGKQIDHFRRMGRAYDLPGYARICRNFRLEPIWVLNVYEETPESVVALLEHLDRLGLKLKAVELGNEPYWDPRSLNDVRRYIRFCQPLAEALHKHKPDLKLGACFGPLQKTGFNYHAEWNAVLAKEQWFDAIVFHDYYGGQGFALEPGERLPAQALLHPEAFINEPVATLTKQLPGKPIWFTEWNLGSEGIKQWKNKGAELLFLGAVYARLIDHRVAIERSMFHALYERGFGTFYFDAPQGQVQTQTTYDFFRLLGAAFAQADKLRPVQFGTDTLLGFATQGSDGVRLFAVNRGSEPWTVPLPGEFTGELKRLTIACPPDETLISSPALAQSHDLRGSSVTLPAYSISLIGPAAALPGSRPRASDLNLFPVRPFFTLWYPPYASQQPQVDEVGVYTINLAGLTNQPMVVVKLNLKGLGLKSGRTYAISFEAKAEPGDTLIVNLPDSTGGSLAPAAEKQPRSEMHPLTESFRSLRCVFDYQPQINDGEVSFFFDNPTVARGGRFVLKNFSAVPFGD